MITAIRFAPTRQHLGLTSRLWVSESHCDMRPCQMSPVRAGVTGTDNHCPKPYLRECTDRSGRHRRRVNHSHVWEMTIAGVIAKEQRPVGPELTVPSKVETGVDRDGHALSESAFHKAVNMLGLRRNRSRRAVNHAADGIPHLSPTAAALVHFLVQCWIDVPRALAFLRGCWGCWGLRALRPGRIRSLLALCTRHSPNSTRKGRSSSSGRGNFFLIICNLYSQPHAPVPATTDEFTYACPSSPNL